MFSPIVIEWIDGKWRFVEYAPVNFRKIGQEINFSGDRRELQSAIAALTAAKGE